MSKPETLSLPNGWHLITYGSAELSVAPDGLLMFPRHMTPEEAPDYLKVIAAAATLGAQIQADNQAKADQPTPPGLSTRHVIVTQGPPPPGATPLVQHRSAIGRKKRGTP